MPEPVLTVEKSASFASTLKRGHLKELMEAPDTPATVLLVICIDHWGTDFFGWEPDVLKMEAKDELGAVLPQVNLDKIWTTVLHLTTNQFFTTLEVFIPMCNALSDSEASFTHFDPAEAEEMAWALVELNLLDQIKNPKEQFSDEIRRYVGEQLRSEGFVQIPKMLSWADFRDSDAEERVDMFSDEPVLFNAIWDRQQRDLEAVSAYVNARLQRIWTILKDLPLMNGSVKDLLARRAPSR